MSRLKENPHHMEICESQAVTEETIIEVFQDSIRILELFGVVKREEDL